jgi:galactoside 2-L-fucosyltransferase 1/2
MGNQMFMLASSYGIAQSRRAKWCVSNLASSKYTEDFIWLTKPLPCPGWSWKIFNVTGDSTFFVLSTSFTAANEGVGFARYAASIPTSPGRNIFVGLFLQSHRYFNASGLPFALRPRLAARAWVDAHGVAVGIHVRRGDKAADTGNVVTPLRYFAMAVQRMRDMHGPALSFVVCTDDAAWVRRQAPFGGMRVLSSPSPAFDMAVLAACRHRIVSIGTFGWWGAYLGDSPAGTTIYPVRQFTAPLIRGFSQGDYFPPHWTPIDYELGGGGFNMSLP